MNRHELDELAAGLAPRRPPKPPSAATSSEADNAAELPEQAALPCSPTPPAS